MKSLLFLVIAAWICGGVGRTLLSRVRSLKDYPLERACYATAIGLGIASYGVLAIGLAGGLSVWPIAGWWLLLGVMGLPGSIANARDLIAAVRVARGGALESRGIRLALACGTVLCLVCATGLLFCFRPPAGHEWDALAYHLADPKLFLLQHRISILPTEHHSNFPFTMELLFACGLLFAGPPLAACMHLLTGIVTALALIAFGRRRLAAPVGWIAAVIFATTPLVLWEASAAYIDVGYGLFLFLATCAAISAVLDGPEHQVEWAGLAGICMGFALGSKYLALAPLALVGALLVLRRMPVKAVAAYLGIALLVGSPWYVKNTVVMGNPVYPFAYRLFPGSRYWSAHRAELYQAEQQSFGSKRATTGAAQPKASPADSLRQLIEAPAALLTRPEDYANVGDFTFSVLLGGLYAGLCFGLAFLPGVPQAVRYLLWLAAPQIAVWFFAGQIGRYLVSLAPLFAVPAGYAAARLAGLLETTQPAPARAARWLVAASVGGQVLLLFYGVTALPVSPAEAMARGTIATSESIPAALNEASSSDDGQETLRRTLDEYVADAWINANTARDAGVVLYDETRGFYLDRPYLWGNGEHSSYIPYDTMRSGSDLTHWLNTHGIRYALINLKFAPNAGNQSLVPDGILGSEPAALQSLYVQAGFPPGSWRRLVADAIATQAWTLEFARNGVVVLKVGAGEPA